jgi:hypothetical protein
MAAAHLRLGRKVDGWADNNCLQPKAIGMRHRAPAKHEALGKVVARHAKQTATVQKLHAKIIAATPAA